MAEFLPVAGKVPTEGVVVLGSVVDVVATFVAVLGGVVVVVATFVVVEVIVVVVV